MRVKHRQMNKKLANEPALLWNLSRLQTTIYIGLDTCYSKSMARVRFLRKTNNPKIVFAGLVATTLTSLSVKSQKEKQQTTAPLGALWWMRTTSPVHAFKFTTRQKKRSNSTRHSSLWAVWSARIKTPMLTLTKSRISTMTKMLGPSTTQWRNLGSWMTMARLQCIFQGTWPARMLTTDSNFCTRTISPLSTSSAWDFRWCSIQMMPAKVTLWLGKPTRQIRPCSWHSKACWHSFQWTMERLLQRPFWESPSKRFSCCASWSNCWLRSCSCVANAANYACTVSTNLL